MTDLTNTAALVAIIVFLLKEIVTWFKNERKDHAKALHENTLAVTRLTIQIEHLERQVRVIPELEKDVAALGAKLRSKNGNSEY